MLTLSSIIVKCVAKVEQTWKLQNNSNFFDINIGVGYGVDIATTKPNFQRSGNYKNYSRELPPEDDITLGTRTYSRQIKINDYPSIPDPSILYDPSEINFEKTAAHANSFPNTNPTITELQNVVSNIGDTSQASEILQVVKVPAVYEFHIQSTSNKKLSDTKLNSDMIEGKKLTTESIKNNWIPYNGDQMYVRGSNNHMTTQNIEPNYSSNQDQTKVVDDHSDIRNYVKETTGEYNSVIPVIKTIPFNTNNDKKNRLNNANNNRFQSYKKTSNNNFASSIPPNFDSSTNLYSSSFGELNNENIHYSNIAPNKNAVSQIKYTKSVKTITTKPAKPVSSSTVRYNLEMTKPPYQFPRKNKSKFNTYSTLSSFVPYGFETRHKRKPSKYSNGAHNIGPILPQESIYSAHSFTDIKSKRNLIDSIQLTTSRPERMVPIRQSFPSNHQRIYTDIRRTNSDDTKFIPFNFKIHIAERKIYVDDR